ncbi:hypothetical protein KAR91_01845 [Candidatus Pacearchaeota archaeon]|nr:hypothetical protein [Candidatus Pacearchaeota archaeon]
MPSGKLPEYDREEIRDYIHRIERECREEKLKHDLSQVRYRYRPVVISNGVNIIMEQMSSNMKAIFSAGLRNNG